MQAGNAGINQVNAHKKELEVMNKQRWFFLGFSIISVMYFLVLYFFTLCS